MDAFDGSNGPGLDVSPLDFAIFVEIPSAHCIWKWNSNKNSIIYRGKIKVCTIFSVHMKICQFPV